MHKYLFIAPTLKLIAEGRLFSRVFAVAIRVIAVLLVLAGIVGWFQSWRLVFDLQGFGVIGGIIFQAFFLVGIYMVTHVLWIRASDIANQPVSDFTVIPIVSIFLKMLGEVYACLWATLGAGGGILILLAGNHFFLYGLMRALPGVGPLSGVILGLNAEMDSTFLAAIVFFFSCVLTAFFALVTCYLLAEAIVVFVDIARNIRAMRRYYEPQTQTTPDA